MHQCLFCEREFTQKTRLAIHTRAIHYGVKHECPFPDCSAAPEASTELKKHLAKRHNMVDPELSEKVKKSIASVKERYNSMMFQESEKSSSKVNEPGIIMDDQPLLDDKPEMMIIEDEPKISPSEVIDDVNEESEISILETSTKKVINPENVSGVNQQFEMPDDKTSKEIVICPYPDCFRALNIATEAFQHLKQIGHVISNLR